MVFVLHRGVWVGGECFAVQRPWPLLALMHVNVSVVRALALAHWQWCVHVSIFYLRITRQAAVAAKASLACPVWSQYCSGG